MYLTQKNNNYYVLDIEADSLTPTCIWVVVLKHLDSGELLWFRHAEDFNNWLEKNPESIFIGHNAISFDIPVLNRLWNCGIDLVSRCIDSLVLSYLYRPAMEGGHSLEAWGGRLKFPKGEYDDWSRYSWRMLRYCVNDVNLTHKLYSALTKRLLQYGCSELACEIEHKIRIIIDQQQRDGFWFDKDRADKFRKELRDKQTKIEEDIQSLFPPKRVLVREDKSIRTMAGHLTSMYLKDKDRYEVIEDEETGTYCAYDLEPFNLGSPKQRVERLLELGWEPSKFTDKGFPKVDEDALVGFSEKSGRKEVAALAEWLVLQGRASMLDTWFNNLGADSRIHGRVNSCGAASRRMTHSNPNTANIPSGAKARYGKECRSFWGVEPGRNLVLVGYDASGLETAGLCHYLNNKTATEILLNPKPFDVHTINSQRLTEALGWDCDREWAAKTGWYAWLYGAYPPKLGEIVRATQNGKEVVWAGETVIDTFFRNVPGLKELIESVQREWRTNNGRLRTIDGGFVWCHSQGAALNYKIQSMGAILMKLAAIILDEEAKKLGIQFKLVGSIHDEGQLECEETRADELGRLAVWSIEEAGRRLKLNVAVTGSYLIGKNWEETH